MSTKKYFLDLYDICDIFLRELGFSFSDLGKLYVKGVFSMEKKNLLSSYNELSEKAKRKIKGRFEKALRSYFFDVKNAIIFDNFSKKNFISGILYRKEIVFNEDSIEGLLKVIIDKNKDYEAVGKAVLSGAKAYVKEKPRNDLPYKYFLEYNRIQKRLEEVVNSERKI